MAPKTCTSLALSLILLIPLVSSKVDCPPKPKPTPPAPAEPEPEPEPEPKPKEGGCPRDALKLGVCSSILNGHANFSMGMPNTPCCTFFHGLIDFDAAFCLCTALKANICGININIPFSFSFLLNICSLQAPSDFQCS